MISYDASVGCWVVSCDTCSHGYMEVEGEFKDAVQLMKDRGWRISKDRNDEWTHSCEDCN